MARGRGGAGSSSGRLPALWSELRASFGLPAGLAIIAGVALGFTLPALDDLLDIELPTFAVQSQQAGHRFPSAIAVSPSARRTRASVPTRSWDGPSRWTCMPRRRAT